MAKEKKLTARKKPSQERSRQTVEKILNATRDLLKQSDSSSSARLTTQKIAKAAGISVGSLYQYFPNTEAVVFEVYREILDQVQKILDRFESLEYLSLPRDEFFRKLNQELTKAEPDSDVVIAMLKVSKMYPAIEDEERRHAESVARRIAGFLKHFGSRWPTKKLERLVLYIFYMDHGAWMYRAHVKPSNKEVLEWEVRNITHAMAQCFED